MRAELTRRSSFITVQWVDSGISVWFFPRSAIPSDISAGAPLPDGWGTPMASWPATDCEPSKFFNSHSAIFDTTLWCVSPELSCARAGLTDRPTDGLFESVGTGTKPSARNEDFKSVTRLC